MRPPRTTVGDWYRVSTVGDGVTYICEPHIEEFYRCNMWHVRGRDRDMLVDSGMGVVSLRAQVPLLTGRSCIAVASHTHFDHIGAHHEFQDRYVHVAECDTLARPNARDTLTDLYVRDEIFTRLPPLPYESSEYVVRGAPATRLLEDGDVIDLGDRHFEVIHTPGHSPGGIVLWEARTGILFSGDILYDGPLIEDCFHSNAEDYLRSMRRLLALRPRIVHGGHFPSFDGGRYHQLIRDWLATKER